MDKNDVKSILLGMLGGGLILGLLFLSYQGEQPIVYKMQDEEERRETMKFLHKLNSVKEQQLKKEEIREEDIV